MSSMANLSREELLKREKELKNLLNASKPKVIECRPPPPPPPPPPPAAVAKSAALSLVRNAVFPRLLPGITRARASFIGNGIQQKVGVPCPGGTRASLSHNRVFVRQKASTKQPKKLVKPNGAISRSLTNNSNSNEAKSSVSAAVLQAAESSPVQAATGTDDALCLQLSMSPQDSQTDTRSAWMKNQEKLVLSIGGDDSSDDDEQIRNHHAALRNILHPHRLDAQKILISRGNHRKSVVFQSATKLVKNNSAAITGKSVKHELENETKNSVLQNRNNLLALSRVQFAKTIKAPEHHHHHHHHHHRHPISLQNVCSPATASANSNHSDSEKASTNRKSLISLTSLEMVRQLESKLAASSVSLRGVKSEQRTAVDIGNKDPTSATSYKRVLKRSRFKLLKGASMANKKATSTHKKVSKKAACVKANKNRPQTLLMLRGVPFQSSKGGKALKRINTSLSIKIASTKTFVKSRLHASVTPITRVASQLVNRSVYKLNMRRKSDVLSNARSKSSSSQDVKKDCIFYMRFGKCHKGTSCKFHHDPKKVSICTKFLRGTCKAAKCPFSHKVDKDKMPLCSYFQRGQCNATDCPYRHSYFRKDIPHCENFLLGFCEKGQQCTKQHVLVCTNSECSADPKRCPLYHKKKTKTRSTAHTTKERKRRRVVVRKKATLDRDEAWPEFVTLSGSDDEVVDVQLEMPTRASDSVKRFLERRARPVWPDYSQGLSAEPIELRQLLKASSQLRQTLRKARWLRKVRPIKTLEDFIPLDYTPDPVAAVDRIRQPKPKRVSNRRSRKSSICSSAASETSSSDYSQTSAPKRKEQLFETDDDDEFDPAYRTYGDALRSTQTLVGSTDSISSYTSPSDSSDESLSGKNRSVSLRLLRHHVLPNHTSKRIALNDDDDWLLDYLCHCEESVSPLPEPERLNYFGPVYEHWEFRTGDRIRETIGKFKRKLSTASSLKMRAKYFNVKRLAQSMDFIPLRDHEEGEILSESDGETIQTDDLVVIDMELASDDEVAVASFDNSVRFNLQKSLEKKMPPEASSVQQFIEDVSDLEEGEVL